MLQDYENPDPREAQENLRVIRNLMERSTKHSTFSGLSGVLAGVTSIAGCIVTRRLQESVLNPADYRVDFILTWVTVVISALCIDYLLTKRRAANVGKRIISSLGKQMAIASAPGLGTGAVLTLFFVQHGILDWIFPVWMLCYGIAVCAVGLFSRREVSLLGAAFLVAGAITLFLPSSWGLCMTAVTFGGFHIVYGAAMSERDGWS